MELDDLAQWEIEGGERIEVHFIESADQTVGFEQWEASLPDDVDLTTIPFERMNSLRAALAPTDAPPPEHIINFQRGYFEWGASASGQTIVLFVSGAAVAGVVGNLAYDTLKATVRRMVTESVGRSEWKPEPLTADEALERAKWFVAARFDIDYEDVDRLELQGEEHNVLGSAWTFVFRLDGVTYEAELVDDSGLFALARLARSHGSTN